MEEKEYRLQNSKSELRSINNDINSLEYEIRKLENKINEQSRNYNEIKSKKDKFDEKLSNAASSLGNGKNTFQNSSALASACDFLSRELSNQKRLNVGKIENSMGEVNRIINRNKMRLDDLRSKLQQKKERSNYLRGQITRLENEVNQS